MFLKVKAAWLVNFRALKSFLFLSCLSFLQRIHGSRATLTLVSLLLRPIDRNSFFWIAYLKSVESDIQLYSLWNWKADSFFVKDQNVIALLT